MATLLLAVLLQVQEPTNDDRIAAFAKGDAAARAELVKLGVYAIRPLQKARDKAPEKIDALVYDLKKAAAVPACAEVIADLEILKTCDRNETSLESLVDYLAGSRLVDAVGLAQVTHGRITVSRSNVPARILLDEVCREFGLDYGIFHNRLVIGRPEFLWPDGPPAKTPKLDENRRARAGELLEKLGDDEIGGREAAAKELVEMGPAVAAVLETALPRLSKETASRCMSILARIKRVPKAGFGAPGVDQQEVVGADAEVLKWIKEKQVGVNCRNTSLEDLVSAWSAITQTPIEVDPGIGKVTITVRAVRGMSLYGLLSLLTQIHNLDFVIQEGVVRIVKPEVWEKK